MSLLDYFRNNKKTSASIARDRLQIIVSHQRITRKTGELDLATLQREIIEVIKKYLPIEENKVTVEVERDENRSILELNVVLPETVVEEEEEAEV